MKKILIIAWSFYPSIGGMEKESYLLAKEFIKMGYEVDVLTEKRNKQDKDTETYDRINIIRSSFQSKRNFINLMLLSMDYLKFSVTHRNYYAYAIIRGALTFEPIIFGLFKFVGVFKTKTFVTADTGGENDEIALVVNSRFRFIYRLLANQHNYLNSICSANTKNYISLGINKTKLTSIPNGVDILNFKNKKYPNKIKNFFFLGRLVKLKGISDMLSAFLMILKENKKVRLYIGGVGSEEGNINKFIQYNNIKYYIKLIGRIEPDKTSEFISKYDCLILPSYTEGLPLVALETAVCKRALILSDVSDLRQIFGYSALYFTPKHVDELYSRIKSIISDYNPKQFRYDEIIQKYDIKNVASMIDKLFI